MRSLRNEWCTFLQHASAAVLISYSGKVNVIVVGYPVVRRDTHEPKGIVVRGPGRGLLHSRRLKADKRASLPEMHIIDLYLVRYESAIVLHTIPGYRYVTHGSRGSLGSWVHRQATVTAIMRDSAVTLSRGTAMKRASFFYGPHYS